MRTHAVALALLAAVPAFAADPPKSNEYLDFVRSQATALRAKDAPPGTRAEWEAQRDRLRGRLLDAWGGFPEKPCPLDPKLLGTLKRDGYTVEKVVFQTLPGVWMTANAYVPEKKGKVPAILMVHGHWKGAKQDPVVQSRCIGAAKLGFFVLCVDAFGAGERGVGTALGEYHGEMTAATLLPVGRPLSGLQVYENGRAVDYLRARPEVDGGKIGVTGASGGGNQSMYAGAWDTRFSAAVPVCSVGNYQAYLGAACCMCEVVPGALTFTEESGVLGLTAPRALMVVNATRDGRQFSVEEAKKSLAAADPVFKLYGKADGLRHAIFESPHDYNKAMREAMYGWMAKHLKGEGDGSPIPEPVFKTENPEDLRCYPGETRPKDFVTVPKFAAAEGRKLLAATPDPAGRSALVKALGGFPEGGKAGEWADVVADGSTREVRFSPEPGLRLSAFVTPATPTDGKPVAIVLDLAGRKAAEAGPLFAAARKAGWTAVTLDLRATGALAYDRDTVGRAPDHTTAEWGLWVGRPLLGQWTLDVRKAVDDVVRLGGGKPPGEIVVIGNGPAGLVALAAAATDDRVTKAAAVGTLASFVSDEPYVGQRLGTLVPGILKHVGDVPHLAALAAPRKVVVAGGVWGNGKPLTADELTAAYAPAAKAWRVRKEDGQLVVTADTDPAAVLKALGK